MDKPPATRDPAPVFDTEDLPRIGEVIDGKYRVERLIGTGGMGLVIEVTHVHLREPMALKILRPEAAKKATLVSRFQREGRASVRIKSEHVARVNDVGVLPSGDPYMVMELLTGTDLQRLCRERGPLPVGEAVEYVVQACEGVAAAHELGIIHRDLKPGNLFLTWRTDGSPLLKVVDFGVSKILETDGERKEDSLTAADGILGSPLYMSPEQIRYAKGVDARADVWSLGAILYRLIAGRSPFDVGSIAQILVSIVADEPEPLRTHQPAVPAALEAIVARCLEKDHKRRIQSAAELARELAPFRAHPANRSEAGIGTRVDALPSPVAVVPPSEARPMTFAQAAPAPAVAPLPIVPALQVASPATPVLFGREPSSVAPDASHAARSEHLLGLVAGAGLVVLGGLVAILLFGKEASSSGPSASMNGTPPPPRASTSAVVDEQGVAVLPAGSSPIASALPPAPSATPTAVESANPLLRPGTPPSSPTFPRGKARIDPLGDRL